MPFRHAADSQLPMPLLLRHCHATPLSATPITPPFYAAIMPPLPSAIFAVLPTPLLPH